MFSMDVLEKVYFVLFFLLFLRVKFIHPYLGRKLIFLCPKCGKSYVENYKFFTHSWDTSEDASRSIVKVKQR